MGKRDKGASASAPNLFGPEGAAAPVEPEPELVAASPPEPAPFALPARGRKSRHYRKGDLPPHTPEKPRELAPDIVADLFPEISDDDSDDKDIRDAFKINQMLCMRVELCKMVQISGTWDVVELTRHRHTRPLLDEVEEFQMMVLQSQTTIETYFDKYENDEPALALFYPNFKKDYDKCYTDYEEIGALINGALQGAKRRLIHRAISDPDADVVNPAPQSSASSSHEAPEVNDW
jgi:hypothetical protein